LFIVTISKGKSYHRVDNLLGMEQVQLFDVTSMSRSGNFKFQSQDSPVLLIEPWQVPVQLTNSPQVVDNRLFMLVFLENYSLSLYTFADGNDAFQSRLNFNSNDLTTWALNTIPGTHFSFLSDSNSWIYMLQLSNISNGGFRLSVEISSQLSAQVGDI
jgi:hypothetical protein